jgi:Mn2+/Fe2+ NRAMP family transporter
MTFNHPATENTRVSTPIQPIRVSNKWAAHALTFLMVFGPGLIVMEADNDAGAVSTYVQAGAQYGTHLLWLLLLLLPICYFIQEMVVRLGIATGQGHAAMIYRASESGGAVFHWRICYS